MPVRKCKKDKTWYYQFELPGSTRLDRKRASGGGFDTMQEAIDAEADRTVEERQKTTTLGKLLDEFLAQHVDTKLAPKTAERYHEQAGYIHAALRDMPIGEITPLHLYRANGTVCSKVADTIATRSTAGTFKEDRTEHRRCSIERVHPRHPVGLAEDKPGDQQRAARAKEVQRSCYLGGGHRPADRSSKRTLVPLDTPGYDCGT